MRSIWLLARNWLVGRRGRTALMIAAVALAASLVVAVSCSIGSVQASLEIGIVRILGATDARIPRYRTARRRMVCDPAGYAVTRSVGSRSIRVPVPASGRPAADAPAVARSRHPSLQIDLQRPDRASGVVQRENPVVLIRSCRISPRGIE